MQLCSRIFLLMLHVCPAAAFALQAPEKDALRRRHIRARFELHHTKDNWCVFGLMLRPVLLSATAVAAFAQLTAECVLTLQLVCCEVEALLLVTAVPAARPPPMDRV